MLDRADFIHTNNQNAWLKPDECDKKLKEMDPDVYLSKNMLHQKCALSKPQVTSDDATEDTPYSRIRGINGIADKIKKSNSSTVNFFFDDGDKDSPTIETDFLAKACKDTSVVADKIALLSHLEPEIKQNKNGIIEYRNRKHSKATDDNLFAKEVIESGNFMAISKVLYFYNGRFWEYIDKEDLAVIIKKIYPEDITIMLSSHNYSEIYHQIKTDASIQMNNPSKEDCYYINFRNGVYDIKNNCMMKHAKDYYFFSCINYDYYPSYSNGEVFEEYIMHCARGNKEIRHLLLQMIGYIMSDLISAKAFFVLLGDRDAGKSTFGNLIISIIGEENRSALNFHELVEKWTPATLHGKKLVLDMDVSCETVSKNLVAMVNKLTGHDLIVGQVRYKNQFTFTNTCKILIAANTLPSLQRSKHEEAFVKRMVVIPFGDTIPDECKDPDMLEKLKTETNYIVTVAMDALRDLICNNFIFTLPEEVDEIKQSLIYRSVPSSSETVHDFIEFRCSRNHDYFTPTATLHIAYLEYLEGLEIRPQPLNIFQFGSELAKILGENAKKKYQQQRGFAGIRLLA